MSAERPAVGLEWLILLTRLGIVGCMALSDQPVMNLSHPAMDGFCAPRRVWCRPPPPGGGKAGSFGAESVRHAMWPFAPGSPPASPVLGPPARSPNPLI